MIGYLILAGFLASGCVVMDALLASRDRLVRLWLGLCAGLMLMMWLPALFAFALRFDRPAQLLGLASAAAIAGACALIGRRKPRWRWWCRWHSSAAICNSPISCAT